MDMKRWLMSVMEDKKKKAFPILSFPCVQLTGASVGELVRSPERQAEGMKAVAERTDALAAVSYMDLSLEAEAFGAEVRITENEVPTVIGRLVKDEDDADRLQVPDIDSGRIGIYLEGLEKADALITDRPVFAGVIGPFSLAGRLTGENKAFLYCRKKPEILHTVLEKATEFLISYIRAYKDAGADGVMIAEPLAGMLSPKMAAEFSCGYVKRIAEASKADDFTVMYHNCGNAVHKMLEQIYSTGCDAYHFGNATGMKEILDGLPDDRLVMGNIDPAEQFTNGTPESMKVAVSTLMKECAGYDNFVISSGCDIPPAASWDNIDAFFEAAEEFFR